MFSTSASFDEFYQLLVLRKVPFLIVFFMVTFATYGVLYAIDFIPEPIGTNTEVSKKVELRPLTSTVAAKPKPQDAPAIVSANATEPVTIIFDSLDGKKVRVLNPTSRDVASLDTSLLSGVVRHPDSADFKNVGNIFILGHSSYLPNVMNKNFQAFNGIQKLTWGDTIRLQSSDTEYVYRVEKVYKTTASEAVVAPTPGKAKLTLATCNSFGTKDDRFIVEAALVSSKPL